jgi:hypothetical protein
MLPNEALVLRPELAAQLIGAALPRQYERDHDHRERDQYPYDDSRIE